MRYKQPGSAELALLYEGDGFSVTDPATGQSLCYKVIAGHGYILGNLLCLAGIASEINRETIIGLYEDRKYILECEGVSHPHQLFTCTMSKNLGLWA